MGVGMTLILHQSPLDLSPKSVEYTSPRDTKNQMDLSGGNNFYFLLEAGFANRIPSSERVTLA